VIPAFRFTTSARTSSFDAQDAIVGQPYVFVMTRFVLRAGIAVVPQVKPVRATPFKTSRWTGTLVSRSGFKSRAPANVFGRATRNISIFWKRFLALGSDSDRSNQHTIAIVFLRVDCHVG